MHGELMEFNVREVSKSGTQQIMRGAHVSALLEVYWLVLARRQGTAKQSWCYSNRLGQQIVLASHRSAESLCYDPGIIQKANQHNTFNVL
jgi:hypothetical protein